SCPPSRHWLASYRARPAQPADTARESPRPRAGSGRTVAARLAQQAGRDPALARATVHSFRTELGPPAISWRAALELELSPQMWSLRRRASGRRPYNHGRARLWK